MEFNQNPRYWMWCRLIPGYEFLDGRDRKKAKNDYCGGRSKWMQHEPNEEDVMKALLKTSQAMASQATVTNSIPLVASDFDCKLFRPANYFGCCSEAPTQLPTDNEAKKETNMYDLYRAQSLSSDKKHLLDRVTEITSMKTMDLRKTYRTEDDPRPETPNEIVKRIKDGLFIAPSDEDFSRMYVSAYQAIKWRDPAKPADIAGYNEAQKRLTAAETRVEDDIFVLPATDALASLRAFETMDFATAPAN